MKERCCARPILKKMAESSREWKGVPSTTQLLKGTMQAFLEIKHDFAQSPDRMAFMLHGTDSHARLEEFGDEISQAEVDLSDKNGSIRPDVLECENGIYTLIDYKFCGSFQVAKALGYYYEDEPTIDPMTKQQIFYKSGLKKGKPKTHKVLKIDATLALAGKREWALQTNNYRIGLEKKLKIKIDRIRIQAVVRDGGTIAAISRGIVKNIYYMDIPRLNDEQVKKYFAAKKKALLMAVEQGHYTVPCDDLERWEDDHRCKSFCPVAKFCPYWVEHYSKCVDADGKIRDNVDEDISEDGLPKEAQR